jgi:hypothetical protein
MWQRAGIILHGSRVVLYSEAGGGVSWAIQPVTAVEPTPAAVAAALLETLAGSRMGAPMPGLRDYKDPVRGVLKVSERRLLREGATAAVERRDEGWSLQPWAATDEHHWEPDGEPIHLAPTTPALDVAERLLAELRARLPDPG